MNLLNLFNGQPKKFDVSSIKFKKPIDSQLTGKLIDYLQFSCKHLSKHDNHKIMVGVDGEINSLIVCILLKEALGENMIAMILDFGSPLTNNLVYFLSKSGIQTFILKRGEAYRGEVSAYQLHNPLNIRHFYKRFVNYHLLIQADHMKVALADTADKSDRLLGTRPEGFYGHLMPFYSLYKSEVYDLAKFLNVPDQLIPPSSYQDLSYPEVVLTWDKIDPIIFLLAEKQLSPEEISQNHNIDLHWLKRLKSQIDKYSLKTTISQFLI